jgi:hypothetical protein
MNFCFLQGKWYYRSCVLLHKVYVHSVCVLARDLKHLLEDLGLKEIRRVPIRGEKWLLALSRLSVCPSVRYSTSISVAPTGRIFVKSDFGDFYGNRLRNSNFVKFGKKISDAIHDDLSLFHIVGSNIRYVTMQRTHSCVAMAKLLILHCWQWHMYLNDTKKYIVAFK